MAATLERALAPAGPAPLMWAQVLPGPRRPLMRIRVPVPDVGSGGVLVRVEACGLCRLDVDLVDEHVPEARYPVVPGHAIVGEVVVVGHDVHGFAPGDRAGLARLAWSCGHCQACLRGLEHRCEVRRLTGATLGGGAAEYARGDYRFCVRLPRDVSPARLAPLLCEGAAAHRGLRAVGDAHRIGVYGAGPVAALAAALARRRGRRVETLRGAADRPAAVLDAALVIGPGRDLVRNAIEAVAEGGHVVRVADGDDVVASVAVPLLAGERRITSVVGATRRDVVETIAEAAAAPVEPAVEILPMAGAEEGLGRLRSGRSEASVVLVPDRP